MAAVLAGAAITVGPAIGAAGSVNATPQNTWSQSTVTVNVGEQVTFHNTGGYHDVVFEDGQLHSPASPSLAAWTASRRFDKAGSYRFYCSVHGGPGGTGMAGVVVVADPSATTTPTPQEPLPTPPVTFSAKPVMGHFCVTKSKTCTRPGIRLRLNLSAADTVKGTLQRRPLKTPRGGTFKAFGSLQLSAKAGRQTVRLPTTASGKKIGVGDYRLTLTALGKKVTTTFFVRPS
jgi:plastocyanin